MAKKFSAKNSAAKNRQQEIPKPKIALDLLDRLDLLSPPEQKLLIAKKIILILVKCN